MAHCSCCLFNFDNVPLSSLVKMWLRYPEFFFGKQPFSRTFPARAKIKHKISQVQNIIKSLAVGMAKTRVKCIVMQKLCFQAHSRTISSIQEN